MRLRSAPAAVAAVVVVDRAVRSAGKAFSIEQDLGPQRCGPSRLKVWICAIRVYAQVHFAYNRGPRRGTSSFVGSALGFYQPPEGAFREQMRGAMFAFFV